MVIVHIGERIQQRREALKWGRVRLAQEANRRAGLSTLTYKEIKRYEKGERSPVAWLPFIAEALGCTPQELTGPSTPTESPTPKLSDFLSDADPLAPLKTLQGRRIGTTYVRDLEGRVHGLRLADDTIAGRDLYRPALRELRAAVRVYRSSTYPEEVGRQLLVAIAELAQIAGWIASDAGEHEEAEKIYRLGLYAAHEAGDLTLAGNLLGSLAYQTTNVGNVQSGLEMAQAALEGAQGAAPPRARALYWDRVAWAHAKVGQHEAQPAMRALGEAGEALAQHGEEDEPEYLYWVSAGELEVMESRVYTELHRPLRAVPLLSQVLDRYDTTHARELALYLSWLVIAYADANEPEMAAETASRMFDLSEGVASDRTDTRGRLVIARLQPYADVPEVQELLQRQ